VAPLGRAWQQHVGGLSDRATGPLTGGLVPFVVALLFLLGVDWGRAWPAIPIVIGVGVLLPAPGRRQCASGGLRNTPTSATRVGALADAGEAH